MSEIVERARAAFGPCENCQRQTKAPVGGVARLVKTPIRTREAIENSWARRSRSRDAQDHEKIRTREAVGCSSPTSRLGAALAKPRCAAGPRLAVLHHRAFPWEPPASLRAPLFLTAAARSAGVAQSRTAPVRDERYYSFSSSVSFITHGVAQSRTAPVAPPLRAAGAPPSSAPLAARAFPGTKTATPCRHGPPALPTPLPTKARASPTGDGAGFEFC